MGTSFRSTFSVLGLAGMTLAIGSIVLSSQALAGQLAGQKDKKGRLEAASSTALAETQRMLTTPKERQKALDEDARAKAMDSSATKVVGEENMADVYALASDLMATLAEESQGDPLKMMELLQQAQKNPEILEGKFTPEQRAKIKEISQRLPASAPAAAPANGLK